MSDLKAQIDIQRMYDAKINSGKNDIEKRDDVIADLQRKLKKQANTAVVASK